MKAAGAVTGGGVDAAANAARAGSAEAVRAVRDGIVLWPADPALARLGQDSQPALAWT
jgi:mevalonate pyrophosphate decarboxylase